MKIVLSAKAQVLTTLQYLTPMEFSGVGWVKWHRGNFHVYDVKLLHVSRNPVETEFGMRELMPLLNRSDRANMKLWFHRHPVGNGIPGFHNWSGQDSWTIRYAPLGGSPKNMDYSLSIVLTPHGWVGRYDTYGKDSMTIHIPVTPQGRVIYRDFERLLK